MIALAWFAAMHAFCGIRVVTERCWCGVRVREIVCLQHRARVRARLGRRPSRP